MNICLCAYPFLGGITGSGSSPLFRFRIILSTQAKNETKWPTHFHPSPSVAGAALGLTTELPPPQLWIDSST